VNSAILVFSLGQFMKRKYVISFLLAFVSIQMVCALQQRGLPIEGRLENSKTGASVSLSADGSTVAMFSTESSSSHKKVLVYQWNGISWEERDTGGIDCDSRFESVSISGDGNTVAIGARYYSYYKGSTYLSSAGIVLIYEWNGSSWQQQDLDLASLDNRYGSSRSGNEFGYSVSMSSDGNTVAIGAPGAHNDTGRVFIYKRNGSTWELKGYIDGMSLTDGIVGERAADRSGESVSLSADGSTVAIGAPDNDAGITSFSSEHGHVRIYQLSGSIWAQKGYDIDGESLQENSGFSVSLSADGNTVAIGAPFNDGISTTGETTSIGSVKIYQWNGSSWQQKGLDIDGESKGDWSGFSVSLSADGNTVAIGAPYNDGSFSDGRSDDNGHVRIYHWSSSWELIGEISGTPFQGGYAGTRSGYSVSMSADGGSVAIGAPYFGGYDNGEVRVYGDSIFTLTTVGSQGGSVSPLGANDYSNGTSVELTAIPSAGYLFDIWTGNASGGTNPLTVTMSGDLTITANFKPDTNDDDQDGLTNFQEIVTYGSNPDLQDSSGDGLTDKEVVDAGFDPTVSYATITNLFPTLGDSNGNGLSDAFEASPDAAVLNDLGYYYDSNGNGLSDAFEASPNAAVLNAFGYYYDSNGNGLSDAFEASPDAAVLNAFGYYHDSNGNGMSDAKEA
jgi:uncharacterized repeat protein (TIGR02543 family)